MSVDSAGNLYIADYGNSRIRKVNTATGVITTVAGNGSGVYSGDGGPATSAGFAAPGEVIVDSAGNLYITDYNGCRIRKVAAGTGIITTVAGTGTVGYSGDGGPATSAAFHYPGGVGIDSAGNLYIADQYNDRIRKVSATTGIITTVAGNGTQGYSGDGGPATSAELYYPGTIAIDSADNVYFSDQFNNRIRKIDAKTQVIIDTCGYWPVCLFRRWGRCDPCQTGWCARHQFGQRRGHHHRGLWQQPHPQGGCEPVGADVSDADDGGDVGLDG